MDRLEPEWLQTPEKSEIKSITWPDEFTVQIHQTPSPICTGGRHVFGPPWYTYGERHAGWGGFAVFSICGLCTTGVRKRASPRYKLGIEPDESVLWTAGGLSRLCGLFGLAGSYDEGAENGLPPVHTPHIDKILAKPRRGSRTCLPFTVQITQRTTKVF
jgi:hypothetical protein